MFIAYRKLWYSISAVLVLGSLLAFGTFGLKLGVEFTGGTLAEYSTKSAVQAQHVQDTVKQATGFVPSVVTTSEGVILRMPELTAEQHAALTKAIKASFSDAVEARFEVIGPAISQELRSKAVWAVLVTLALICAYIAWSFRKVSGRIQSWKYGLLVILTGIHDAIIPVGVFALLGHFAGVEVSGAFVAAILTILGYSINDTIVIFDRVRENMNRMDGTVEEIVSASISQSLSRSLKTSITTVLALLSVLLFGGESTKTFALALIVGIVAGTYSSIFLGAPLLVDWQKK